MVFNIMRYSVRDGPGLRTTVFLKGCPLSCLWCHNPESQAGGRQMVVRANRCIACGECVQACREEAIALVDGAVSTAWDRCIQCGDCALACAAEAREAIGEELSAAQVMAEVLKDLPFYEETGGGVTFSGGEPLAQAPFLETLLAACRAEGLHTAVDTSGAAPWEVLDRVRRHTDLFLYDLKLMNGDRHRQLVGASNRLILDNLQRLAAAGSTVLVRVAIIPGINDDAENLAQMGAFVGSLENVPEIAILPYHETAPEKYRLLRRDFGLGPVAAPTPERMAEIADTLGRRGLTAQWEGEGT